MKFSQVGLTSDEKKLRLLVQEVLYKNGVLKSRTEREWNIYCTRRILHDFLKMMKETRKETKEKKRGGKSTQGRGAPVHAPDKSGRPTR